MNILHDTLNKILIICPAWIGDMVMAQVLFKLLQSIHNNNLIIDILVPKHSQAVAARMPEVNNLFEIPIGHGQLQLELRYNIAKKLARNNYQQAIILPNSLKSALIPFFARIPKRTGYIGEMRFGLVNDVRKLNKKKLPLMIDRFTALAYPKSILPDDIDLAEYWPKLVVEKTHKQATLESLNLDLIMTKKIICLCPGAEYGQAKRWPAQYFAQVAKQKLASGYLVCILGSKKERVQAQLIQEKTNNKCLDLTGQTTLAQAIDLLSLSDAIVCNDSGLMHVGAGVNRPMVVIYGSSDPRFTPPLSNNAKIVSLGLPCSPCFQRDCKYTHFNCLTKLMPARVINALDALVVK